MESNTPKKQLDEYMQFIEYIKTLRRCEKMCLARQEACIRPIISTKEEWKHMKPKSNPNR